MISKFSTDFHKAPQLPDFVPLQHTAIEGTRGSRSISKTPEDESSGLEILREMVVLVDADDIASCLTRTRKSDSKSVIF